MKTLRMKLTLGLATLALAASLGVDASAETLTRKVNEYEGQHRIGKVNEYEGQHRLHPVNEYEGQHLAQAQQGDPSQWG